MHSLRRERYLVLRGLRVAQAMVEELRGGTATSSTAVDSLLGFLEDFAVAHHLPRAEALTESWEAEGGVGGATGGVDALKAARDLASGLVRSARESAGQSAEFSETLEKLVQHLSQTVLRGDDTLDAIEAAHAEGGEELAGEVADAVDEEAEVEARFLRIVEELEARYPELGS